MNTDDRRLLTIQDLTRTLVVQNKLTVNVSIEDAAYAGTFRSTEPTELHLVKALDLFFKRYDAGILCSSVLNIAIWRDTKYYNIFDGQPRKENCEPTSADDENGTAKLFLVRDLIGVLFIILEKSHVKNEPFVIYGIAISGVDHYTQPVDTDKPEDDSKPQRRPSGYKVQEKYRAVVQGSYHIMHTALPSRLRGRTHLIIALAALVYSRLVNANKWTSALIDLIFNQSSIYFVDLIRVLDKDLDDEEFALRLDDAMGDVILGVYSAKVKIRTNVVPGYGQKKARQSFDEGMRTFFETQECGLLDLKTNYYAIWKHDDTYYYLDPWACDDEGFRSPTAELESAKLGEAACVTMNSSLNQVVETIMENTGSRDRDPFVIHGVRVLYVKTGSTPGGPLETVIYREKGTNRRPTAPLTVMKDSSKMEVGGRVDMTPKIRPEMDRWRDVAVQVPELMPGADNYTMTEDEPQTYVVMPPEEDDKQPVKVEEEEEEEEEAEGAEEEDLSEEEEVEEPAPTVPEVEQTVKIIRGYRKINPHRLVLQGSKNTLDEGFEERSRGKQGLISALIALTYRRLKHPTGWRNMDIDQIVDVGDKTYGDIIEWIRKGRPDPKKNTEELGEEEEEEEEDLEEEQEQKVHPVPSHLDLTMLPVRLKMGENDVFFKTKMKIIQGEAVPLANLAEALECYFKRYPEMVFENKNLMYGIWRDGGHFFIFNPYGSDEEGWRLRDYPASFAVVANLNELVDLLYGIIEFNDPTFIIHFVGLDSIQPGLYSAPDEITVPPEIPIELFKTKFLPITDEDLLRLEEELMVKEEEETEVDIDLGEEEEEEEEEEYGARRRAHEEEELPIIDPLLEVPEREQPDAPYRLNLILLTSNMKITSDNEEDTGNIHLQVALEKLKYSLPPPYVMPSSKTLLKLLDAKRAKRSIPSLVSRFSIDSRLDVKKKGGFSSTFLASKSALVTSMHFDDADYTKPAKLIKLSPKRYLYSRILPICLMPLRAINDMYIQDDDIEKARQEELQKYTERTREGLISVDEPDVPVGVRIRPQLVPLGPIIRTPIIEKKGPICTEKKKRKCMLAKGDEGDSMMEKILCNTEDLLLELFFPDFRAKEQVRGFSNKFFAVVFCVY